MAKKLGKRTRMANAGALCGYCRSHDVRFIGRTPLKYDHRPEFKCGSCGSEWTAGTDGKPYSDFVNVVEDWFNPEKLALEGDPRVLRGDL